MRHALHHYCLGGCSALLVCVRHSRHVRGAGLVPGLVLSPPPRVPRGACSPLPLLGVPCPRLHWYAIPGGPFVPRARSDCLFGACPLPVVWFFTRAPVVSVSPGLLSLFARPLRAVPSQGAGRAVFGGPCPSAFPYRVPCSSCLALGGRGGGPVPVSPCLASIARPHGAGCVWPGQPVVRMGWAGQGGGWGPRLWLAHLPGVSELGCRVVPGGTWKLLVAAQVRGVGGGGGRSR